MGKELCDILVICDPAVIVISVKEILLKETIDPAIAHARWERKAVQESVGQIYGAEGWLQSATNVVRNDGQAGLKLPPAERRQVFRIAVAFGDNGKAVIKSGNYGEGFVHVMTEQSFREVLSELDTITDFTDYLKAKEAFAGSDTEMICEGSEANMLGWYLTHERTFPTATHLSIFDETIWAGLQTNPSFLRRKEADRVSYVWDRLTEVLSDPNAKTLEGPPIELTDLELALRVMARESRFARRGLSAFVREFLEDAKAQKTRARLFNGTSGIIYVFVYFSHCDDAVKRREELTGRCYVARYLIGAGSVIIGIGLSPHIPGKGSTSDLTYMQFPGWTAENEAEAIQIQKEGKFWINAIPQRRHIEEYPDC